jgi:hypothetical protein
MDGRIMSNGHEPAVPFRAEADSLDGRRAHAYSWKICRRVIPWPVRETCQLLAHLAARRKQLVYPLSNVRRWRASLNHGNGKSPADLKRDAMAA